jgi:hypothetical protein
VFDRGDYRSQCIGKPGYHSLSPSGLPAITSSLIIRGAGADRTILERASSAPPFRLVHVAASGHLALSGVTLRGGFSLGGGLWNQGGAVIMGVGKDSCKISADYFEHPEIIGFIPYKRI